MAQRKKEKRRVTKKRTHLIAKKSLKDIQDTGFRYKVIPYAVDSLF